MALDGVPVFVIRSMTRRQSAERRLADLQAEQATERRLGDIAAEHTERLDFALDCANAGLWDRDFPSGRFTWSTANGACCGSAFSVEVPLSAAESGAPDAEPVPPGELRRLMQELVTAPPVSVALG